MYLVSVNGKWSNWGRWTSCSSTCATNPLGTKRRQRACNSPPPSYNGKGCSGNTLGIVICNENKECPGISIY